MTISFNIIYQDFLGGQALVPLELCTVEDKDGFSVEIVRLSKDIRLMFDDGSVLIFMSGTSLDEVSSQAELYNDYIEISDPTMTIVPDKDKTITTTWKQLFGDGFYDGFQEWWFITRLIESKTVQYLRFNLVISDDNILKEFPAGTRWDDCVRQMEYLDLMNDRLSDDFMKQQISDIHHHFCQRNCVSPAVPIMRSDAIPDDLLENIHDIIALEDPLDE
jgi:hypothetical protein